MVKVKISEIKANPFKRFINDGELDSDRIDKLVESIEHGTLPTNFTVRKNDKDEWEQTSGHHRLAAFKKKYGKGFEVDVTPVKFSDELMLVDLVRENITQRDSDFQDKESSIILSRNWLQSKALTVKQFNSETKKGGIHKEGLHGTETQPDSCRSVAKFLSKNGKTISYATIKYYIDIHDKLDTTLHKKVMNNESISREEKNESIGIKVASFLTSLPKEKQVEVYEQIEKNEMNRDSALKFIKDYKKILTPEIVSEKDLEEEPDETEELISFEKDFKRTANEYQNTLFLINKITNKHYSNAEIQLLIETIEDTIKEENKAITQLKKVMK